MKSLSGEVDNRDRVVRLANRPEALSRGLIIKWYPACWSTHRATSGVIALVKEHNLKPSDIATI